VAARNGPLKKKLRPVMLAHLQTDTRETAMKSKTGALVQSWLCSKNTQAARCMGQIFFAAAMPASGQAALF
jgi:hypothetical protein